MYIIREMKQEEYFLLRDFLYEAIPGWSRSASQIDYKSA